VSLLLLSKAASTRLLPPVFLSHSGAAAPSSSSAPVYLSPSYLLHLEQREDVGDGEKDDRMLLPDEPFVEQWERESGPIVMRFTKRTEEGIQMEARKENVMEEMHQNIGQRNRRLNGSCSDSSSSSGDKMEQQTQREKRALSSVNGVTDEESHAGQGPPKQPRIALSNRMRGDCHTSPSCSSSISSTAPNIDGMDEDEFKADVGAQPNVPLSIAHDDDYDNSFDFNPDGWGLDDTDNRHMHEDGAQAMNNDGGVKDGVDADENENEDEYEVENESESEVEDNGPSSEHASASASSSTAAAAAASDVHCSDSMQQPLMMLEDGEILLRSCMIKLKREKCVLRHMSKQWQQVNRGGVVTIVSHWGRRHSCPDGIILHLPGHRPHSAATTLTHPFPIPHRLLGPCRRLPGIPSVSWPTPLLYLCFRAGHAGRRAVRMEAIKIDDETVELKLIYMKDQFKPQSDIDEEMREHDAGNRIDPQM